jgi:hypothetical protein
MGAFFARSVVCPEEDHRNELNAIITVELRPFKTQTFSFQVDKLTVAEVYGIN